MKWCLACGAVQWGASSCEACGETYRADAKGFRDLYESYAGQLRRFVRRVAADRRLPESLVDTEGTAKNAPKRPAPPVNPDEVVPEEQPVKEEVIEVADARTAAWASFCQAILGSAEFQYIK